jgi:hypothetical protein
MSASADGVSGARASASALAYAAASCAAYSTCPCSRKVLAPAREAARAAGTSPSLRERCVLEVSSWSAS